MHPRRQSSADPTLEHLLAQEGWARSLARRLVRDASSADDLVQATWVAAIERPPATDAAPRRWLAAVLRKLAARTRRGDARRAVREAAVARPEAAPPTQAEKLELGRRLFAAVESLDEPYRSTVWARFFEGLPPRAIAAREGVPVKTVKTRLARGLARLRARLERELGPSSWLTALVPLAGLPPEGTAWNGWEAALVNTKLKLAIAAAVVTAPLLWIGLTREERRPSPAAARAGGADGAEPRFLTRRQEAPPVGGTPPRAQGGRTSAAVHAPTTGEPIAPRELDAFGLELSAILDSFYGAEPRIDALQALVPELAERATIDPQSVAVEPRTGVVTARVALDGLAGTVEIDGDAFRVDLRQFSEDAEWAFRDVAIGFDVSAGVVATGRLHVQHHLDPSDLPPSLGLDERAVGWNVSATREHGTNARAIAASLAPDGLAMIVSGRADTIPPIERPGDWDLRGFEPWRARLEPLRR